LREQRICANGEKSMMGLRHISVMTRTNQDNSYTPQLLMCEDNIEGGISGCRGLGGLKNLKE